MWWVDLMANLKDKDAERCNSGVLDMKVLDNLECFEGACTLTNSYF